MSRRERKNLDVLTMFTTLLVVGGVSELVSTDRPYTAFRYLLRFCSSFECIF